MNYELEYGRYKKKCDELMDAVEAYKQVLDVNNALVAVLLKKMGAARETPVPVTRAENNEALRRCTVQMRPTDDGDGYLMYVVEAEA